MKYILFSSLIFLFNSFSNADFLFIQNQKIYQIPSAYAPEKTTPDKAQFLKIENHYNKKNGTTLFKVNGVTSSPLLKLHSTPVKAKSPKLEGCSENPMKWLQDSQILGQLNTQDLSVYVQVSTEKDMKISPHSGLICPDPDRFVSSTPTLTWSKNAISFLICADDLNHHLLIMQNNKLVQELALTESCP